jgi:plasmid replication initiation protein
MPKKTNVLVKEANTIARARISPAVEGVWDGRIIATIAARNTIHEAEFTEQRISIRELFNNGDKPISNSQFSEIRKALTRLVKAHFEIQTPTGYFLMPIFERVGVDGGEIVGKFNRGLAQYYLELRKQFAMYSLPAFRSLSSIYAQTLFRYLSSWRNEDEVTIPLEEIHELLRTPPSFRKDFRSFRKYVLEVAYNEITDVNKANFYYEWEPVKKGLRKVIAIKFCFNPFKSWREKRKREQAERV